MSVGPGNLLELQEDDQLALLVKDWDFKKGQDFKADILARFGSLVHHPSSSSHGAFHLLAVFRRFTFRLMEGSVSLALHAVLGGSLVGFHITCIKDRHFSFSVASKLVGFSICELKRIISNHFDVYFHLWRWGANWFKESNKWREEEIDSWQLVCNRKRRSSSSKHVSFAPKLVQASPTKKSVPQEISLPNSIIVGDFTCQLNPNSGPSLNRAQISNAKSSEDAIPIKVMFDRLKGQMTQNKQINGGPKGVVSHDEPKRIEWRKDSHLRCYRFLGWGILPEVVRAQSNVATAFTMDTFKRNVLSGGKWAGSNGLLNRSVTRLARALSRTLK
jgi:hypothetical protein